ANRRSGSLSVIDPRSSKVVAESDVGRGLADVAPLPDGRHLLAVDQSGDALVVVDVRGGAPRAVGRRAVSPDPVGVLVLADGPGCVVASRGSRRLTFLRLDPSGGDGPPSLGVARTLELPFRPRDMAWLPRSDRLVVADAFGGKLAVVDPARAALVSVRALHAH